MMDKLTLKLIIEALLMSSGGPLTIDSLMSAFEEGMQPTHEELEEAIIALSKDLENRAIELKCIAGGYCLQTKPQFNAWIARGFTDKPAKYSNALLEVLAIIAYKQPVTRADIEEIRGVALSSSMLKTLIEREWIQSAGCRDVPGKPVLYKTTKMFLNYFNLVSIHDLPPIPDENKVYTTECDK